METNIATLAGLKGELGAAVRDLERRAEGLEKWAKAEDDAAARGAADGVPDAGAGASGLSGRGVPSALKGAVHPHDEASQQVIGKGTIALLRRRLNPPLLSLWPSVPLFVSWWRWLRRVPPSTTPCTSSKKPYVLPKTPTAATAAAARARR